MAIRGFAAQGTIIEVRSTVTTGTAAQLRGSVYSTWGKRSPAPRITAGEVFVERQVS